MCRFKLVLISPEIIIFSADAIVVPNVMNFDLPFGEKNDDENNSYSSTLIRKKQDLLDIALENSCWPVFVHVSFNPPLPSKVFESINHLPTGVYCSSTFFEPNFDNELLIDDNVELCIADLNSYPLIKFLNKLFFIYLYN